METELGLQELQFEPTHESLLDCYRLALDFGPAVAMQVLENLDAHSGDSHNINYLKN